METDKPLARVVPEDEASLEDVRKAVVGLRALRAKIAERDDFHPLTDSEIKAAINEGRR